MMRSSLLSLVIVAIVSLASTAHVLAYSPAGNQLEERAGNVCKSVKVIVTLLKAHKATPFCSSFLGITTKTVTKTTRTRTTTSVETQVITIPTTTTTTWTTL